MESRSFDPSRFEVPPDILAKALRIADIVVKASLARNMNNLISGIERETKAGRQVAGPRCPSSLANHLKSS